MQVGLVVMDEDPAGALTIVRAADRAGIHSLWSIDYYNRSSLTRAAAFAAVSETAIVGTSVTPLFARAPLALAAAAADVQGIAGGRFVLGVGSSTRRMNQDWYGTALQHPAPQGRGGVRGRVRRAHHRLGWLSARHGAPAAGRGCGQGRPGRGAAAGDHADRGRGQRRPARRTPGRRGSGRFLLHAERLRRALPRRAVRRRARRGPRAPAQRRSPGSVPTIPCGEPRNRLPPPRPSSPVRADHPPERSGPPASQTRRSAARDTPATTKRDRRPNADRPLSAATACARRGSRTASTTRGPPRSQRRANHQRPAPVRLHRLGPGQPGVAAARPRRPTALAVPAAGERPRTPCPPRARGRGHAATGTPGPRRAGAPPPAAASSRFRPGR
jgi:hypothetical protein